MIKTSIEKLSREIGFDIGNSDDVSQANLLNVFFEALDDSLPDKRDLDTRLCYIVDKSSDKSFNVMLNLIKYIEFKRDNKI